MRGQILRTRDAVFQCTVCILPFFATHTLHLRVDSYTWPSPCPLHGVPSYHAISASRAETPRLLTWWRTRPRQSLSFDVASNSLLKDRTYSRNRRRGDHTRRKRRMSKWQCSFNRRMIFRPHRMNDGCMGRYILGNGSSLRQISICFSLRYGYYRRQAHSCSRSV